MADCGAGRAGRRALLPHTLCMSGASETNREVVQMSPLLSIPSFPTSRPPSLHFRQRRRPGPGIPFPVAVAPPLRRTRLSRRAVESRFDPCQVQLRPHGFPVQPRQQSCGRSPGGPRRYLERRPRLQAALGRHSDSHRPNHLRIGCQRPVRMSSRSSVTARPEQAAPGPGKRQQGTGGNSGRRSGASCR